MTKKLGHARSQRHSVFWDWQYWIELLIFFPNLTCAYWWVPIMKSIHHPFQTKPKDITLAASIGKPFASQDPDSDHPHLKLPVLQAQPCSQSSFCRVPPGPSSRGWHPPPWRKGRFLPLSSPCIPESRYCTLPFPPDTCILAPSWLAPFHQQIWGQYLVRSPPWIRFCSLGTHHGKARSRTQASCESWRCLRVHPQVAHSHLRWKGEWWYIGWMRAVWWMNDLIIFYCSSMVIDYDFPDK